MRKTKRKTERSQRKQTDGPSRDLYDSCLTILMDSHAHESRCTNSSQVLVRQRYE